MGNNMFNNNNNKQMMVNPINPSFVQPKGPSNLYNPGYFITPQYDLFKTNNFNMMNNNINANPMSLSMNVTMKKENQNSSLLSVLKILFYCFQDSIIGIINFINNISQYQKPNPLTISTLNVIKFMGNEPANDLEISNLNTNIQLYRNNISTVLPKLAGNYEITPFIVFHEIYTKISDDLKIYNNYFPSSVMNNLCNISGLDIDYFKQLYQKILTFQKTKQSPISDYFYYIMIDTIKCPLCSKYYYADINYSCFLEFDASYSGKVSDMIIGYIKVNSINNNYLTCNHCLAQYIGIKNLSFLARPKYLMIYFKGKVMGEKTIDDKIDLSQYCFPNTNNIGPNKYSLFAFIKKSNITKEYNAFIKIGGIWYVYNTKKLVKSEVSDFIGVYPYIVVYKGE